MVFEFFDKKPCGGGITNSPNKKVAEELYKPINRNFNKRKVHSPFIDDIWGVDLGDMQLKDAFNKGFRFLLCVIDIFSK